MIDVPLSRTWTRGRQPLAGAASELAVADLAFKLASEAAGRLYKIAHSSRPPASAGRVV